MTPETVGPFSRPIPVGRITVAGIDRDVVAEAEERAALAADLGLAAIEALSGRFRLTDLGDRIRVEGRIRAKVQQICVVTLDPFPASVDETVRVEFATPDPAAKAVVGEEVALSLDHDPPDELLGDSIDLGTVTSEFLALGLDPYPRKPGVAFEAPEEEPGASPFGRLAELKRPEEPS